VIDSVEDVFDFVEDLIDPVDELVLLGPCCRDHH
jgi:hypothetical protein